MGPAIAFATGTTDTYTTSLTKRATVTLSPSNALSSGVNFWNGVDVSSQYLLYSDKFSQGQSTIPLSRPTAWTTPSITDQNLLNLVNTLPDRVGLTPFTNINVALEWLQNSQKYFLINNNYEGIFANSQVLNLDAGWSNSYPTSGTTWTDLSGQGNNGALTNGPTFSTDGQGSILFDGTDDYVTCGNASSFNILRTVTMELWFKVNGFGSPWTNVFGKMDSDGFSSSRCYTVFINSDGYIHFVTADSTGQEFLNSTNFISTGVWYHWVGTIDRNAGVINQYVNGVFNSTGGVRTTDIVTNSDPVRVGYQGNIYTKFNGIVAVARIYNTALTAQQVVQNYNMLKSRFNYWGQNLFTGNTQYLDFSKEESYPGTGTAVSDLSGNSNGANFNNGSFTTFEGVKCFNSTGTSSFLISNAVTLGNNYTIFSWSNMLAKSQVSSWRTLFRSNDSFGEDHELIVHYGENVLGYYDNKNSTGFNGYGINVATVGLENQWVLYTIVGENGTSQKVYINDGTTNAGVNKNATGQQVYAIGNYQGTSQQWGYVSNYILYNNRVMTQSEIARYYNSTKQYYGYSQNNTITRDLVFSLDAGNMISYPLTGTTWFDLSNSGFNTTLYNGPTFSTSYGGTIDFDSTDDYASPGSLGGGFSTFTVEIWFKSDSVTNHRNPIDCNFLIENGSYSNLGPRLEQATGGNLGWVVGSGNNVYAGLTIVSSGLSSAPVHYAAITKTSASNFNGYYNGNYVTNLSFSNWPGSMLNLNLGRGFSTSSERWFDGNIPVVRIYNRALSDGEIKSNFNAQKARFGL